LTKEGSLLDGSSARDLIQLLKERNVMLCFL